VQINDVKILQRWCSSGFRCRGDSSVDASVSEKHTVAILRAEVTMLGSSSAQKMETVCFSETMASSDESIRRRNPEEQHHHPHRRENLKSQTVRINACSRISGLTDTHQTKRTIFQRENNFRSGFLKLFPVNVTSTLTALFRVSPSSVLCHVTEINYEGQVEPHLRNTPVAHSYLRWPRTNVVIMRRYY
jgi:hypothetical protein